jgi:peptide/nickel transport system ATP-binding protein
MADDLLTIKNLSVEFDSDEGRLPAVSGVDLIVRERETVGIVGESGCGKSVTCLSILGLLPPNGRVRSGEILFRGQDLLQFDERRMEAIRGRDIAMIFQDPMTSLNPIHTIGRQIMESLQIHHGLDRRGAERETVELLRRVGFPEPRQRMRDFPHQLSGGMNQRAMIAMALAGRPQLLIADEPTTALDVTIQAQILELLRELRSGKDMAVILITHDLGIIAELTERVAVMYAGCIVELASVHDIFHNPIHPYTHGLLSSLPRVDRKQDLLVPIEGTVPALHELPAGCHFEPRCKQAVDPCREAKPPMKVKGNGHWVACFNPEN